MTDNDIKNLRWQMGLTQEEFARLFPVSRMTVYKWETGKVTPNQQAQHTLQKLRVSVSG